MGALWQILAAAALAVTAVPALPSTVVVPALAGQSVDSASRELARRGLTLTVVSGPDAAASIVDRQKPDPGTEVDAGRTVTVTTKAAPLVALPSPPSPPEKSASLAPWLIATGAALGTFAALLSALVLVMRPKPAKVPSPKPAAPRYAVRVQPRVSPAVVHLRDPWTLS